MNPASHRLVFNAHRRCLMAVAETAKSAGKSGGGTRRKRCGKRGNFHTIIAAKEPALQQAGSECDFVHLPFLRLGYCPESQSDPGCLRAAESHASATAQVSSFTGKNVSITASQDLVSVGSNFTGKESLTVEGKNSQSFFAATDTTQSSKSVQTSSSMLGISMGNSSTTDTQAKQVSIGSTLTSNQAINVNVGNSANFQGANLTAKDINFNNINGKGQAAGTVTLGGSVDTTQTSHTQKSDTLGVYQSMSGSGSTTQTLNMTQLNGNVNLDKDLNVAIALPKTVTTSGDKANTAAAANQTNTTSQASVQSQIDELSKQPGLAYLKQLSSNAATNNPTQWSQVQLAHDNWSYQSQGLTPAGAALLSIAVAAYAPGLSSGLTSSITSVAGASAATALNAGFVALQAQTAVAMANNGGDIGKTLQQLGSEQSVKNLLITMATAGALDKLNSTYFADGKTATSPTLSGQGLDGASSASSAGSIANNGLNTAQASNAFQQNLLKNVTNNVAGSAIDAAISGKPFDQNTLAKSLTSALITAGMAQGANSIGDAATGKNGNPAQINAFTQAVAHAVLGCASGAAIAGNGSGCSAGAVGAVVGEMAADYATNTLKMNKTDAANFAKVMSATAGVLSGGGGDNVAAVNIANTTGTNAAENNYLKHAERLALDKAQSTCYTTGDPAACSTASALQRKDQLSDKLLSNAAASCKGAECNDVAHFIQTQISALGCTGPSACPDYNTLSNYLRVAQEKAQGLEPVYPEGWVLDAKAALDLGKFGVKVLSGAAGSKGSLDALGQLAKTDATTATNNFYRDGSIPANWTNGKPGDASLNLATHWEKHGAEFPNFSSASDYYRGATDFVTKPPSGTLVKTAPNGDVLLYNPATNTFGVRTADGLPRTMFKPEPSQHGYSTNIDFWNSK